MSNPERTPALQHRWTKRDDGHTAVYLNRGNVEIDLSTWKVEDGTWSADIQQIDSSVRGRDGYQREQRDGFPTSHAAKTWAEAQVPA
jgi:hypothetical protein